MSRVLERSEVEKPSHWFVDAVDGVSVSCPLCWRSHGVRPSESGAVAGFQCGTDRCSFHDDLQLDGYAPAPVVHNVKVADALHMDEGAIQSKPTPPTPPGLKIGRK